MPSRSLALPAWLGTTLLACVATLVLLAHPQPALAAVGCWTDAGPSRAVLVLRAARRTRVAVSPAGRTPGRPRS